MHENPQPLFTSEEEKVAYCRAFLEQRGFSIQSPLPKASEQDREAVSVFYIRASTGKQELSGPVQKQRLTAGLEAIENTVPPLARVFEDLAVSGSKRLVDRIAGRQLFEYLQPGDHLWITHFDRLGRNTLDSLMMLDAFARRGVKMHVIDFLGHQFDILNPEDGLIVHMFCALAQYYRQQISIRTKAGIKYHREKGGYWGNFAPIGTRRVGKRKELRFVDDYHDQKVCNIIWCLLYEENMSSRKLMALLKERKVPIPHIYKTFRGWDWQRLLRLKRMATRSIPFPDCPPDTETELDDLKAWPAY